MHRGIHSESPSNGLYQVPAPLTGEDRIAASRLNGLLDYVEALVKLDERVVARLAQHKLADGSQFILHEHEFAGLTGMCLDSSDSDGAVWLRMQRLQRTAAPPVAKEVAEWIEVSNDPTQSPTIREVLHLRVVEAEKNRLIAAKEARAEDCVRSLKTEKADGPDKKFFDVMVRVEDRSAVVEALDVYCAGPWAKWAEAEKPRRRSIAVYQRLFEIAQRLLQSGGNESMELVWGIGVARWNRQGEHIDIPMIERAVEIEIADQSNADITVRPRALSARVELRAFEKLAPATLALAEDAVRRCLRALETPDSEGVSPFRRETFEPILRICGSQLDPEGRYLPDHRQLPSTEGVPAAEGEYLTVSDRFVLFARRRSANSVLRDIECLKASVTPDQGEPVKLDGAARTLVMGPTDGVDDIYQPLGDKLGAADAIALEFDAEPVDPDHGDLFFPKPFNNEQVAIIRRLEKSDGLVVQGPPGTGKTHTIANIISHMLATGRRVLVVSHGETALTVIREQLPDGVRDLAISVTTSEREGLKQVEKAIGLMLEVVNMIATNRSQQIKLIRELEASIVANRKRLAAIDEKLAAIADRHLSPIPGSTDKPYDAAKRIMDQRPHFAWFTDRPRHPFTGSGVSAAEIEAVSGMRKSVGADLKYIDEELPSPANLPDAETVCAWHEDLVKARNLRESAGATEHLTRRVIVKIGVQHAADLARDLKQHSEQVAALQRERWAWALADLHAAGTPASRRLRPAAMEFLAEARAAVEERAPFVTRPVQLPPEIAPAKQLTPILDALIAGKNPFGLWGFTAKPYRANFEAVRVAGVRPKEPADWHHVSTYIAFTEKVTSLASRWDVLRYELAVPDHIQFSCSSLGGLNALVDTLHASLVELPANLDELHQRLTAALGNSDEARAILSDGRALADFAEALSRQVASVRLGVVSQNIAAAVGQFECSASEIAGLARNVLANVVGQPETDIEQLQRFWRGLLAKLARLRSLEFAFQRISETCRALSAAGAVNWADRLHNEAASAEADPVVPSDWQEAWDWASRLAYLEAIGATDELAQLHGERLSTEEELRNGFARLVKERTFFNLAVTMKGSGKAALQGFANIVRRLGAGSGQRAVLHRQNARQAMEGCFDAVPCWIMPSWRVSEQLPAALGAFDLVILDEASQSDAREIPTLLRGKKVLVVGDDRQVSPSVAFLSIANVQRLRQNFLAQFPFRSEVEPGSSIYDLARVMFPDRFVMLKEHFRCVEPIIRFSMRFYNQDLVPLRVPKASERLDPPLIDILVEGGERRGKSKINPREADVIVSEIEKIVVDPDQAMIEARPRSIGVISLIGAEQALYIQKLLMERIGEAAMVRHRIVCGDSAMLQGDERDIVFLSMVADSRRKHSQTAMQYQQRFNVALSRARDRMVLVRSVRAEELNANDLKAKVIQHFAEPMPNTVNPSADLIQSCQSGFERAVFTELVQRGYRVIPQVGSQGFAIDMVVEGDGGRRLAIECDGDQYHGPQRWADDMNRQRILERVGWTFWRCFGSNFSLDREGILDDLIQTLDRMEIKPVGAVPVARGYTLHRVIPAESGEISDSGLEVGPGTMKRPTASSAPKGPKDEVEEGVVVGDRVMVRYIDDEHSRPESYLLSDKTSDPKNGVLLLSSPLGKALSEAAPGEEFTVWEGDRERTVLFVAIERESAQAA
jgi:very-short-patch-repair endonuclease